MIAKLGRKNKHRSQMLKNLCISILLYEKVTTTQAKAKNIKFMIEKSINIAKNNDLYSRRKLLSMFLNNKLVVKKLIEDLGPRFKNQQSGFVKLFKNKPRLGDNALTITIILSKSKFLNNLPESKKIDKKNKK